MRIISKFKDYYDCIQSYGQDSDCVWMRMPRKLKYVRALGNYDIWGKHYYINHIGFCGKVYQVWWTYDKGDNGLNSKKVFFYNVNALTSYVSAGLDKKSLEKYVTNDETTYKYYRRNHGWGYYKLGMTKEDSVFHTWNKSEELVSKMKSDIFEKYHTPIWIARPYLPGDDGTIEGVKAGSGMPNVLIINAKLSSCSFESFRDPYTAYQEIFQYYSGVLGGVREVIPEVSNDDMIEAKGFDLKYSFRKEKSK